VQSAENAEDAEEDHVALIVSASSADLFPVAVVLGTPRRQISRLRSRSPLYLERRMKNSR